MSKYITCPDCRKVLNTCAPTNMKKHRNSGCGKDLSKKITRRVGREAKLRSDEKFIREVLAA